MAAIDSSSAISRNARPRAMPVVLLGTFALLGAVFLCACIFVMLQSRRAMRTWNSVPCTIVSARVVTDDFGKRTTFFPEVIYRYVIDGRRYQSKRYAFFEDHANSRTAPLAIVRRYPPGSVATCRVNPTRPEQAVLNPQSLPLWAPAIPGAFVVVGALGMIAAFLRPGVGSARRGAESAIPSSPAWSTQTATIPTSPDQPLTLRSRRRPIHDFITLALLALFFTAVISLAVWHEWRAWLGGSGSTLNSLRIIPFVLVSLFMILVAVHAFLVVFDPRVRLTLSRGAIEVGGTADLQWAVDGRFGRIRRLTLCLEGREEVTFRHGKDVRTDTSVFANIGVIDDSQGPDVLCGRGQIQIPPGAAPTFRAAHNKLVWVLKVRGRIPCWPDVKEDFEIEVTPSRVAAPAPLTAGAAGGDNGGDAGLSIEIEGGRTAFAPGERSRGTASWDLEVAPDTLELRLFCYTRGKGIADSAVAATVPIPRPQQRGSRAFDFKLPDRPPTFRGQLISLVWAIELIAHPGNRSQRKEIVVAPGGQEIRLDSPINSGVGL